MKFGFLKSKHVDIKKYLSTSHEIPELKVLFAPSSTDAELSIIDIHSKKQIENKTIKIKENAINIVDLPAESYAKFALTGNKMHFACKLYAGQNGIIIYSKGDLS